MKTKTMAVSLMLTFTSCALFAQNKTDTVPNEPPKTDTIPQKDTVPPPNTATIINANTTVKGIADMNRPMNSLTVYAVPAKAVTISEK